MGTAQAAQPAQLFLPMRNRAAYREQSFASEAGGLFVPGDIDADLGEEVHVEIAFLEEQVRFRIRAELKWRRMASTGSRRVPPGVGLAFLPSEASTRAQLEAFVDGEGVDHTPRDSRRHALRMEVKVDGHGLRTTDDLSLGGCFLLWPEAPPPMGTSLTLKLQAPGALFSWITLDVTVCWHRVGGDRDGIGVRFDYADDGQRRRVTKLLNVLKQRVIREVRVSPPRASTSTTAAYTSTKPASTKPTTSMLPRK